MGVLGVSVTSEFCSLVTHVRKVNYRSLLAG